MGEIRGTVRSYRGKALGATITVEPGGHTVDADEDGFFKIELEPGDYVVEIVADGYRAQKKKLRVTEDGVVVLNVDLKRKR
jgi:uncharacterized membrane protein